MTDLGRYVDLIERFVTREIPAESFSDTYLRLVKSDQESHGEATYKIIQNLFFYADEYYDDPEYTAAQKKKEDEQLRVQAQRALGELRGL